jgi:hypothetical protein
VNKPSLLLVCILAATLVRAPISRNDAVPAPNAQVANQGSAVSIEDRIVRVEHGLMPPVLGKGEPPPNMKLLDRMTFYKVPGSALRSLTRVASLGPAVTGSRTWPPNGRLHLIRGCRLPRSVSPSPLPPLFTSWRTPARP